MLKSIHMHVCVSAGALLGEPGRSFCFLIQVFVKVPLGEPVAFMYSVFVFIHSWVSAEFSLDEPGYCVCPIGCISCCMYACFATVCRYMQIVHLGIIYVCGWRL